jgi:hypothetical protein
VRESSRAASASGPPSRPAAPHAHAAAPTATYRGRPRVLATKLIHSLLTRRTNEVASTALVPLPYAFIDRCHGRLLCGRSLPYRHERCVFDLRDVDS